MPESPTDGGAAVTVAVVSWNTSTLLRTCLQSLEAGEQRGVVDVWVVDNASSDGSAELVEREFPWVRLIASDDNLGFGRAVNLVASRTRSPWIAPANADLEFAPDALEVLLEAGKRHPEAGAVVPRLVLPDGSTQHSVYPFPSIPFTLAYVLGATRVSRRAARHWIIGAGFNPDQEKDVPWAVGAFLLVRRTAWEEIGGFDDQQWMYAEDLDLGWRLREAGWKTRYVPGARVRHAESAATAQAWGGERFVRWHVSTYRWMARRRGPGYARLTAAINVIGFGLRAALLWPAAAARRPRSSRARQDALNAARAHRVGLRPRNLAEPVR